jgi:hypothetical protein
MKSSSTSFPRGWKLEGSNNKEAWTVLDQRSNEDSLSSNMAEKIFACEPKEFYQYFRLTQTQKHKGMFKFFILKLFVYLLLNFLV